MSDKPYQLAMCCGVPLERGAAVADTAVDVTPNGLDEAHTLSGAGIDPADLRSRTLLVVDGDVSRALRTWAFYVGFSGRYLDVAAPGHLVHTSVVRAHGATLAPPRGPERPEEACAGGAGEITFATPDPLAGLGTEDLHSIAHAKQLRLSVGSDLAEAIVCLAAVAGLRSRNRVERLPVLAGANPEDDVDLDEIRRLGATSRHDIQGASAGEIVDALEVTERVAHLRAAAQRPVVEVLALLGSHDHDGVWHCPRPQRHSHGDATPSLRISEETVRCARCDQEPVDALRLVSDVLAVSVDDAADLLCGPDDVWAGLRAGSTTPCAAA